MNDAERIKHIKEALQSLKTGELSLTSFAMVVGNLIDPIPLTEADVKWATNKAKELGIYEPDEDPQWKLFTKLHGAQLKQRAKWSKSK